MKNPEDIEHTFKNAFDSFEEQPSGAVWERINEDREMKQRVGITDTTPESLFSVAFKNFNTGPAEAVWTGIRGYLIRKWWIRTIKWSSLILILGLISGVYIYKSNSSAGSSDSKTPSVENNKAFVLKQLSGDGPETSPLNIPRSKTGGITLTKTEEKVVTHKPIYINSSHGQRVQHDAMAPVQNVIALNDIKSQPLSEVSPSNPAAAQALVQEAGDSVSDVSKDNGSGELKKERKYTKSKPDQVKKNSNIVKYTKETDINNEESPWKIGVMAGLDYGNFYLKGGNKLYQEVRKGQELFNPGSFHTGITFSRMLGTHWYVQSNLVYANQTMLVAYNRKLVQADTLRDGSGNIVRIDQKVIFNVDTNASYRFTTLEIPFLVGFRIGERRWTFHAMAGPSWNLLLLASGSMLSPNSMQVESLQSMPLVKQQWGLWLAVGAGYQLNHHISLTFEPMLRYKFNSVFSSGFPAKQYNYASGVNLGVRYHIK